VKSTGSLRLVSFLCIIYIYIYVYDNLQSHNTLTKRKVVPCAAAVHADEKPPVCSLMPHSCMHFSADKTLSQF
jgi:hypothetical protein